MMQEGPIFDHVGICSKHKKIGNQRESDGYIQRQREEPRVAKGREAPSQTESKEVAVSHKDAMDIGSLLCWQSPARLNQL